jgi:hypothetical protein
MKGFKKISALVLALAMMLTMVSFAGAEVTTEDGTETTSNTFTIAKDIVLFNTNSQPIYEPNVTYTFAITSVNPNGATITDNPAVTKYDSDANHSVTVAVKQGTGGVTITGTDDVSKGVGDGDIKVVFGDGAHDAATSYAYATNAEGSAVTTDSEKATRSFTVTIDPASNAFKETKADGTTTFVPGVYRYKISDTTDYTTIAAAGVKHPTDGLKELILDVYLRWKDTNRDALQVYGYVLFRDLTATENLTYGSSSATTAKVTGFDIPSNMEGSDTSTITSTADEYHTFNVKVSKAVDGNLADVNNAFPFKVALTGISSTEFYWTKNAETTKTLLTMETGKTIETALKHNDYVTIYGLPYNATVKATETNNTPDYYTPSAKFTAGSAAAAELTGTDFVITESFKPSKTAETAIFNNGKAASAKTLTDALTEDVIAFTNKLTEISPTGYVARFAPYALILVAGIALLVLAKKRKPAKEE